jgi:hypothetical protein
MSISRCRFCGRNVPALQTCVCEDSHVYVMTPHHEARCAKPGCAGYLLKGKDGVWRHSDAAEHPESENALHVPLRRKT